MLDLTRVIAGPVATRTLALLGADVLRLDPPGLPELPDQHTDTGFGKRSALLDLVPDRERFEELLAGADVVVTGYRPGALDRFGLGAEALAERRPGVVVAQLSAWGATGPWAGRRGFDSLVQVATGIAHVERGPEGGRARSPPRPSTTARGICWRLGCCAPCRTRRRRAAAGWSGSRWRVRRPNWRRARAPGIATGEPGTDLSPVPWLTERDSTLGRLRYALPPVDFEGGPRDWARAPGAWGADTARWL